MCCVMDDAGLLLSQRRRGWWQRCQHCLRDAVRLNTTGMWWGLQGCWAVVVLAAATATVHTHDE